MRKKLASKLALWASKIEPGPQKAVNCLSASPTGGAFSTILSVMWFTLVASAGMSMLGFTNVSNSEMSFGTTRPFFTSTVNFTAPISMISSLRFTRPVVSKSNATNFGGNAITAVFPYFEYFRAKDT